MLDFIVFHFLFFSYFFSPAQICFVDATAVKLIGETFPYSIVTFCVMLLSDFLQSCLSK